MGRYNAWLPLKQFLSGDTYFLNSNPSTTLTEPGAAERVISVGAYNHITDASYVASGRGYTATGLIKPDFVAPGVDVYGVRAGGGYTTRTGTSVAAAPRGRCCCPSSDMGVLRTATCPIWEQTRLNRC